MGAYGSPELLPPEREKRKEKGAIKRFFLMLLEIAVVFIVFAVVGVIIVYFLKK
jgi:hypothetical protein